MANFFGMTGCSLIITTYNWPEALELVLMSVLKQSILPGEVIIADDGSGDDTKNLILEFKKWFPVPLIHSWHEDDGFRAGMARNRAAALAKGSVLLFLDGDLIMHKNYVEDALKYVKKGRMSIQNRVLLNEKATMKAIANKELQVCFFSKGILKNRKNFIRIPYFNRLLTTQQNFKKTRGGLLSVTKDDYIKVNGYDESYHGWGNEDKDLIIRLMYSGVIKKVLVFEGKTFHLYHKKASHNAYHKSLEKIKETVNKRLTRTEIGVDRYINGNV